MSESEQISFSFTWKIENYSLCVHEESVVTGPQFTIGNFVGTRWYLILFPTGDRTTKDSGKKKYPSLYLRRCYYDMFDKEISIGFTLTAVDGNGKTINQDPDELTYIFKKGTSVGFAQFVSLEKATNDMFNWSEDTLTIYCNMTYRREKVKCLVHTKVKANHHSFNMDVSVSDSSTEVLNKKFYYSEKSLYEVKIALQKDDVKIAIHKVEEKSVLLRYIICKISLLNANGDKSHTQQSSHLFKSADENNVWEFPSFISREQLDDGDYIKNNIFRIFFDFSSSNGMEPSEFNWSNNQGLWCTLNYLMVLSDHLRGLLKNQKHSDIKLRTEEETFSAHKSILSARSPVFSTMFDQDMVENLEGVVDISDVDAKTLKSFLEFMYCGALLIEDPESAIKLLLVAEKYQVLGLKFKCCCYLMEAISAENVCEILNIAYLVEHKKLKKSAMDFITTHVTEILGTPLWKEYIENNNKLMNEVFEYIAGDFQISRKTENKIV